jgi:hypothetical protein
MLCFVENIMLLTQGNRERGSMGFRDAAAQWVSIAVIATAISIGSTGNCPAQTAAVEPRRFDLRIENGRIAGNVKTVEVRQDDAVELKWSADLAPSFTCTDTTSKSRSIPDRPKSWRFGRAQADASRSRVMETVTRSWSTSKCIRGSHA